MREWRCEECFEPAVVGLNGRWLCLECFEAGLEQVGDTVRMIREQVCVAIDEDPAA